MSENELPFDGISRVTYPEGFEPSTFALLQCRIIRVPQNKYKNDTLSHCVTGV